MNEQEIKQIEDLLLNKYEPILIVKMMRMPSIEEIEGFRLYLKNEFGYNTLIFPGEMETDVKIVSVLNSDQTTIDEIQNKMNSLIEKLSNEFLELPS